MVYETLGVLVEGLAVPGLAAGILLLQGSTSGASTGPSSTWVIPRAIIGAPNLSAIGLDPLTGDVRSGALSVQLSATQELCALFARQARARKVDVVLNADLSSVALQADMSGVSGAINPDDLLYLGDELIRVVGLDSGTVWDIERAYAGTPQQGHRAGSNMYRTPPFWVGRAVTIYRVILEPVFQQVSSFEPIWRGYLTEPPSVGQSVTSISLKAEDALSSLRRAVINRAPLRHRGAAPLIPYRANDGSVALSALIEAENGVRSDTSVHRRFTNWIADGGIKVLQIGDKSIVLTYGDVVQMPGVALLDSAPLVEGEEITGPIVEVALWSKTVDQAVSDTLGVAGPSPTIRCEYPYHPLTIAAALLFSDSTDSDEDPLAYNVMHPSCTLGVGFLANLTQWDNLIRKTSHIEIDKLCLFWNGEPLQVFNFITRGLLPAYGFLLAADAEGKLRPIQIGLADVEQFALAPQTRPISGSWEWALSSHGALDAIEATIGESPWREGRKVEVAASGVRDPLSGSRATRMSRREDSSANFPTVAASTAESYGAARLANILAWRYDGLPVVSCLLQAEEPWYLGQFIRLLRPEGLVSPILFNLDGTKVDDLWNTASLIGQIIKLRPDLQRNRYEVEVLLTNYSYGRAARWRAPAARIKARIGIGQYTVEGLASDFGEPASDALSLAVGDDLILCNPALGLKSGLLRSVTSITPSGADWLVTLNADFGVAGTLNDWLYLGTSAQYLNASIVPGEDFVYTFLTTAASLPRPSAGSTPPDEYS